MNEGFRPGDKVSVRQPGGQLREGRVASVEVVAMKKPDGQTAATGSAGESGAAGGGSGSGAGGGSTKTPRQRPTWHGVKVDWDNGGSVSVE